MNSDRTIGRAIADEASTTDSIENSAVHLEIDGTMDLSRFSPPRQPDPPDPDRHKELSRTANEAELRHVIRLQRQALNKQSLRIEQQRSLITRLNYSLKQMRQASRRPKITSWLRSLFPQKDEPEKSGIKNGRSTR